MKKTNLLKSVVCAALLSMMVATTAMATTKDIDIKVRGQLTYTEPFLGTYGQFAATSDGVYSRTTVTNTSGLSRFYNCSVARYNYKSQSYDLTKDTSCVLSNGSTTVAKIGRNVNSAIYDYKHYAVSYVSTTSSSYAIVDTFTIEALQYYR